MNRAASEIDRPFSAEIAPNLPALGEKCDFMQVADPQCHQLEVHLGKLDAIIEVAVRLRPTTTGETERVAYIVSIQPIALTSLQTGAIAPLASGLDAVVPVSHLPRTSAGAIDESALGCIAVADDRLAAETEAHLQAQSGVERAAVVSVETSDRLPPLHLSDLLPAIALPESQPEVESLAVEDEDESEDTDKPLAIADGGPLVEAPDAPQTLAAILARAAREITGEAIVYLEQDGSESAQSYGDLLADAERILGGLRSRGFQPGAKVILQCKRNSDLIPAFWGCLLGGFVPAIMEVPPTYTESSPALDKLCHIWTFLDAPLLLTDIELTRPMQALSDRLASQKLEIAAIESLRKHPRDTSYHDIQPSDPAFFNLTSGSTGMPKCIQLTHRSIIARARGTNALNQHQADEIVLNWLPFDHIGSISDWHLRCVELGCKAVYVQKEYILGRALNWLDLIDKYRVTHSWAPNFAYALINDLIDREPEQSWDLSCVRFLLTAGEAVSSKAVVDCLEKMAAYGFESTAIRPAFGMAELGSGITYYQPSPDAPLKFHYIDKASLKGRVKHVDRDRPNSVTFTDLGPPIAGVTIRIVDPQGEPLPEDAIGRLQVKGDAVSAGYYRNPEANKESFLANGWFDTGDLGFLSNGQLVVTGRAKETIIINGANYYSHELEAVVEEVAGVEVSYTAACAVGEASGATEKLAIFFHTFVTDSQQLRVLFSNIRQALLNKVGIVPDYLLPVAKEAIPKTAIGKIQRKQLSKRFAAGEFDDVRKSVDLLLENENTLPNWFYRPIWRPQPLAPMPTSKLPEFGQTLVFLDESGLGERVCEMLEARGVACVRVKAETQFTQANETFTIAPGNPEHYRQLIGAIRAAGEPIAQVLHFWSCEPEPEAIASTQALQTTQERGIYSWYFLIQALATVRGEEETVRAFCIGSQTQAIAGEILAPAKSPVLGLLRSLPQELPWVRVRHIDIETGGDASADILQELEAGDREREIAYRQGVRYVPRLQCVEWESRSPSLPFVEGGMYLLSGGLGGVGTEIARYLLQTHKAKVLLLGRTPLPPENERSQVEGKLAEKLTSYEELAQLDGEVAYEAADICDWEQVRSLVETCEYRWGTSLAGIVHLAGAYREGAIAEQTSEAIETVLQPKVLGTWTLSRLLETRRECAFVSFSSIAGFFGGSGLSAYSAANCFLDAFVSYQRAIGVQQSYCLAWSTWDNLGLSKGNQMQEILRARGYETIARDRGLASFLAGLTTEHPLMLVGLDGSNRTLQPFVAGKLFGWQRLAGFYTGSVAAFQVRDRFGTEAPFRLQQLEEMPLSEDGEIDRDRLVRLATSGDTRERIAPRNDLERQLATIWQEVLEVAQVSVLDNFFELGGNSIKAMVAANKLQDWLGETFHPVALFEAPTVEGFAAYLQANYARAVAPILGESELANAGVPQRDRPEKLAQLEAMQTFLGQHLSSASLRRTPEGEKLPRAVFVLSPPRSGSTLLRVVLGGHPQLFAPPELYLLSFDTLAERAETFSGRNQFMNEGLLRAMMELRDIDAETAQAELDRLTNAGGTTKQTYEWLQTQLGDRALVDKTPHYSFNPHCLQRAELDFDRPLYIHLQRHPYGVISSIVEARLDLLLAGQVEGAELDLAPEEIAELVWLISQRHILSFLETIPSDRQHFVQFEDLVTSPEETLGDLCQFLGLELHPDMLQPYGNRRQRMTDGIHDVSRMMGDIKFHNYKGIDPKTAVRWKERYRTDFLSEPTWDIAESFGYDRLQMSALPVQLPLVPMQSQGTLAPFFCVHPISGNVLCYAELASNLGRERPFYALQAPGLDGKSEAIADLQQLAAAYVEAMRGVQPHGPYHLGGWSLGGTIAFEMAQQLHAAGEEIALLLAIDSYTKQAYTPVPLNPDGTFVEGMLVASFARNLNGVLGTEIALTPDELVPLAIDAQLDLMFARAQNVAGFPSELGRQQIGNLFRVFAANIRARNAYRPQPYPGSMVFFEASDRLPSATQAPSLVWGEVVKGGCEVHQLPGDHFAIVRSSSLAEALRHYLA